MFSPSSIRGTILADPRLSGRLGREIWDEIAAVTEGYGAHLTVQYVSAHCGVEGNEAADRLPAAASRSCDQLRRDQVPVDLQVAAAAVRRATRAQWAAEAEAAILPDHPWRHATAHWGAPAGEPASVEADHLRRLSTPDGVDRLPRVAQHTLAQLRADHCPVTRAYMHRIKRQQTPACTQCGAPRDDAAHLLLHCPAYAAQRTQHLPQAREMRLLSTHGAAVWEFLQACGRTPAPRPTKQNKQDTHAPPRPGGRGTPAVGPSTTPASRTTPMTT